MRSVFYVTYNFLLGEPFLIYKVSSSLRVKQDGVGFSLKHVIYHVFGAMNTLWYSLI